MITLNSYKYNKIVAKCQLLNIKTLPLIADYKYIETPDCIIVSTGFSDFFNQDRF